MFNDDAETQGSENSDTTPDEVLSTQNLSPVTPTIFRENVTQWEEFFSKNSHILPITSDTSLIPKLAIFAAHTSLQSPNNVPPQEKISITKTAISQYDRTPSVIKRSKEISPFGSSSVRMAKIPAAVIAADDDLYKSFMEMNNNDQRQLFQNIASLTPQALNAFIASDAWGKMKFASLVHQLQTIYGGAQTNMGNIATFAGNKGKISTKHDTSSVIQKPSFLFPYGKKEEKKTNTQKNKSQQNTQSPETPRQDSHTKKQNTRNTPKRNILQKGGGRRKKTPLRTKVLRYVTGGTIGTVLLSAII